MNTLVDSLRGLVAVITEARAFNDPAGALDRIAEHSEGAADTLAEHDANPHAAADSFLAYLATLPRSEFVQRLAGSVRKLKTLA